MIIEVTIRRSKEFRTDYAVANAKNLPEFDRYDLPVELLPEESRRVIVETFNGEFPKRLEIDFDGKKFIRCPGQCFHVFLINTDDPGEKQLATAVADWISSCLTTIDVRRAEQEAKDSARELLADEIAEYKQQRDKIDAGWKRRVEQDVQEIAELKEELRKSKDSCKRLVNTRDRLMELIGHTDESALNAALDVFADDLPQPPSRLQRFLTQE